MKYYIVWDNNKREGFITSEYQVAYEARKLAFNNCYNEDGEPSFMTALYNTWPEGMDLCTIKEIEL